MRRIGRFRLLETEEEIAKLGCEHEFEKKPRFRVINPNGEYVIGYGHAVVSVESGKMLQCVKCGYIKNRQDRLQT